MFSEVKNFILEAFYIPLLPGTEPYNVYNTLLYALAFAGITVYLLIPALEKLELEKDINFYLSFTPWIMAAGAVSAIHELQIIDTALFSSPLIGLGLIVSLIVLLRALEKTSVESRINPLKLIMLSGFTVFIPLLLLFDFQNLEALGPLVSLTVIWAIPGILILRMLKPELLTWGFISPIAAHYLDATSTVVALSLGGTEQQLVAARLIDVLGPYAIFILKTVVIIPVVYLIELKINDEKEKLFYFFIIAALGLGITVRNVLVILAGL